MRHHPDSEEVMVFGCSFIVCIAILCFTAYKIAELFVPKG